MNVQDVDLSDESGRAAAPGKRVVNKGMPKATKKSPYRFASSSPYGNFRGKSKESSSATEDEIGYDSESDAYGSENDFSSSKKRKKKDKRRLDLDFDNDYHPLRLGLKIEKRIVVIEYQ